MHTPNSCMHEWLRAWRGALLLAVYVAESFAASERGGAFVGYSEDLTLSTSRARCQDKDDHCAVWQKDGQCLANPYYMRLNCARSCQIPSCTGHQRSGFSWKGYATEFHTKQYANRIPGVQQLSADRHFRRDASMGSTVKGHALRGDPWLTLSSMGIGTYLGDEDADTDELVASAIITSVQKGWNVIDTASNYRGGRGEKAVGYALAALRDQLGLTREMLFISTKAGFLQDEVKNQLMKSKEVSEKDILGGSSCWRPACLEASLQQSLRSLRVDTVDLLYLHNPAEMQLATLGPQPFMQLLREAFTWAEGARKRGLLRAYGLATWDCLRKPPGSAGYVSLLSLVQLAQQVAGPDHGLRYMQLPINAGMQEAWRERWQPMPAAMPLPDAEFTTESMGSVIEAAGRLQLGVFASGPLQEAALLQNLDLESKLKAASELSSIAGTGPKLVQIARSTPGIIATLVGHKSKQHVVANLALSDKQPLTPRMFESLMDALRALHTNRLHNKTAQQIRA